MPPTPTSSEWPSISSAPTSCGGATGEDGSGTDIGAAYILQGDLRTLRYDLVLTYDWEYDADFVRLVGEAARARGLDVLTVPAGRGRARVLESFRAGELDFRVLLDRASGSSPEFVAIQALAVERGRDVVEGLDKVRWASDKATMHLEFRNAGIPTPHTRDPPRLRHRAGLPAGSRGPGPARRPLRHQARQHDRREHRCRRRRRRSGRHPGGAADLSRQTSTFSRRRSIPEAGPDGRRSWFRGFYVLGEVHLAWWDDLTHIYEELPYDEAAARGLGPIYAIVRSIARVSRLRFFSTEVARDVHGRLVVVDYVNEICDMRLRSVHPDGVPDAIVVRIADRIAAHAGRAAALAETLLGGSS
ncbi:MAG: hypothetical protein M0C28_00495 [Candidatus Moduliflexus flocculans]|nr:hypothetical protein [Candidatus Moduliflexus flocculans]